MLQKRNTPDPTNENAVYAKWADAAEALKKRAIIKAKSLEGDEIGKAVLYEATYNQLQRKAHIKRYKPLFTSKKIQDLL